MRFLLVAAALLGPIGAAQAQVGVQVGVDIGVRVPVYPDLVLVPGYPVYYAPQASTNYFFYDGAYWVFQDDGWFVSSWYDGPWQAVRPEHVPLFVLRVPVRYYRQPPAYFRGWRADAPPRWGDHWGRGCERRRSGWDRWDRRAVPRPAPLPAYQRGYAGDRYPRGVEQHAVRNEHDRYRPHDPMTRQHLQPVPAQHEPRPMPAPSPRADRDGPGPRDYGRHDAPSPHERGGRHDDRGDRGDRGDHGDRGDRGRERR
jgi:hypothetical protein